MTQNTALDSRQAYDLYLKRMKKIDIVQEVRCVEDKGGITIWTIISAPPFEYDLRDPIYDAQIEVFQRLDRPVVDFRVLNVREYPEDSLTKVVPTNVQSMWKR
jgi:hypothetical protein